MEIDIVKLHQEILSIMDEIHKVCLNNNIQYSMLGGSLLGAVRHNGFIPWDDDLDIGIVRDEYNRFIEVFSRDCDSRFYINSYYNKYYGATYIKVMKRNTVALENVINKNATDMGIFVDVFPIDKKPLLQSDQNAHKKKFLKAKYLLMAKKGYNLNFGSSIKLAIYKILTFFIHLIPLKWIINYLEKNMQMYNNDENNDYVNIGGSYSYEKESIRRELFADIIEYDFEGRSYYGFSKSNEYLSHLYGSFMTLPKEEDRVPRHGFIEIKYSEDLSA